MSNTAQGEGWSVEADRGNLLNTLRIRTDEGTVSSATLSLDERQILSGQRDLRSSTNASISAFSWTAASPGLVYVRSHSQQTVDGAQLPRQGTLDLAFEYGGQRIALPFSAYTVTDQPVARSDFVPPLRSP